MQDLSGVKAIAARGFHGLALLAGGSVMAWGGDEDGELGNGRFGKEPNGVGGKIALRFDLPVAVSCGLRGASGIAASFWTGLAYGEISRNECPVIAQVTPDEGPTAGGTTVTIRGTNLGGVTAVTFVREEQETPARSFTIKSDSEIEAVSPHAIASSVVELTNAAGTSAPDSAALFNYIPVVSVFKVEPAYGPSVGGFRVEIEGIDFENVTGVNFGSTSAASFEVRNLERISAVAPPGSGSAPITVTTTTGTSEATPEAAFDFLAGPEFGRCLQGGESTPFAGAGCTQLEKTIPGRRQWYPVSLGERQLQKRGFTLTGGDITLETKGGTRIACTGDTGAGEIAGGRSVTLSLVLTGCEQNATATCQSAGAPEENVTLGPLVGELGVIRAGSSPLKTKVGLKRSFERRNTDRILLWGYARHVAWIADPGSEEDQQDAHDVQLERHAVQGQTEGDTLRRGSGKRHSGEDRELGVRTGRARRVHITGERRRTRGRHADLSPTSHPGGCVARVARPRHRPVRAGAAGAVVPKLELRH